MHDIVDATALAAHVASGISACLNQVVEIKWLAFYHQFASEGVAGHELGVLRRLHHKAAIAQVPDDDNARRCPCDMQTGVDFKVFTRMKCLSKNWRAAFLIALGERGCEMCEVVITQQTRKGAQRTVAGRVGVRNILLHALERGGRQMLSLLGKFVAQPREVARTRDFELEHILNALTQFLDCLVGFFIVVFHVANIDKNPDI